MAQRLMLLVFFLALGACAGLPPVKEYNLANTAMNAAEKANAPSIAPGYWARAKKNYLLAEKLYNKSNFSEAKEAFLRAKLFAERAENYIVLKIMREGGNL